MNHPPTARWNRVSQLLHWLIALLIVGMGVVGLTMTQMALSLTKLKIYNLHKSVGITVLVLVALRLLWRLTHRAPPPLPMPRWQRVSAQAMHVVLYALMFAMPLSGWLFNSASGVDLHWFGLGSLPALWPADDAMKQRALAFHETAFWVLMALVVLHAAAAAKHHWIDKDETLRQMLPGLPPPNGDQP